MLRALVALAAVVPVCSPLVGQVIEPGAPFGPYHIEVLRRRSGLPNDFVMAVAHTPDGYLWLATSAGLVRFDGAQFTTLNALTTPAFEGTSASWLVPVLVDRSGVMWVSTSRGLVQYRERRFAFAAPLPPEFAGERVYRLKESPTGDIWALTQAGRIAVLRGQSLEPIRIASSPERTAYDLEVDSTGTLWVAYGDGGLTRLVRGASGAWTTSVVSAPDGFVDRRVRSLRRARDGSLWIGTGTGLTHFHRGVFTRIRLWPGDDPFGPTAIVEDATGAMWAGSLATGLYRYQEGVLSHFGQVEGLSNEVVSDLTFDREGSVWIATSDGLNRLRPVAVTALTTRNGLPAGLSQNLHRDLSGRVWAVVSPGTLFTWQEKDTEPAFLPVWPRNSPPISAIADAGGGGVWLAQYADTLTLYRGGITSGVRLRPQRAPVAISSVVDDQRGSVWVGTDEGLIRLRNRVSRTFTDRDGLPDAFIRSLAEGPDGSLWVGSNLGLSQIVNDSVVQTFGRSDGLAPPVWQLRFDRHGTLWLGTNEGVARFASGKVVTIPAHAGLAAELVLAIEEDTAGYLWIAGTHGLSRVARAELNAIADGRATTLASVLHLGEVDGLPSEELVSVLKPSSFQDHRGRLWFAMSRGVAIVDPALLSPDTIPPIVTVEGATVDGAPADPTLRLRLGAGTRRVELRYAAVSLSAGPRAQYRYRLDPYDADWVDAGTQRVATYTNLPPGTYRFVVAARKPNSVWREADAPIEIAVIPPIWRAPWFVTALLAAIGLTAWTTYRARERVLERRAAERVSARFEATLAERTRLAGELHDTLLQAFTGVTLQLQALRGRLRAAPDVEHDLGRVLGVADGALRDARSAVWDMRAPEVEGRDVAAALEEFAREAVASHHLGGGAPVEVEVAVTGERRRVSATIEVAAQRIGREAIANALRHARAQHIRLTIAFEPRQLCLDVRDDGVGFDVSQLQPAQGRGHWGIVGMRERARNAGGTLELTSTPGSGTTLSLRLPVAPPNEQ